MYYKFFCPLILCFFAQFAQAQNTRPDTLVNTGGWVRREIIDGDTFYIATLNTVKIRSGRVFSNPSDRDKLRRYRRYANNVRGYAEQAVSLYEDLMAQKEEKTKRQYRRYARQQKKIHKEELEGKLKDLYVEEGKMLIKMVERQTGQPFYEIIKESRGTVAATYWQNMSRIWGMSLKEGYVVGKDPIMDEVLLDFDYGEAIWKY